MCTHHTDAPIAAVGASLAPHVDQQYWSFTRPHATVALKAPLGYSLHRWKLGASRATLVWQAGADTRICVGGGGGTISPCAMGVWEDNF
jgi:hypothetical protein